MKNSTFFYLLIIIFSNTLHSQNSQIQPYVNFLKSTEKKSAKDYILKQFKNHDIVILCERDHRDLSQYELIKEILNTTYFKKHVKNLFTEIGVVNLNPEINRFLQTKGLDSLVVDNKICEFQQNAEFHAIWEKYNYHFLLKTIYNINNNSQDKISYFPSDIEFHWSKIKDSADYAKALDYIDYKRDSIMATNIIEKYKKLNTKKKTKALIIMNYRHAFKVNMNDEGKLFDNTTKYLFDYFGNKATNILINQVISDNEGQEKLLQLGKWDASFKFLNIDTIGFDLKDTFFGKDDFDMWQANNPYKYENIFDGFVFYKPVENHRIIWNFKGLVSQNFENELFRRMKIAMEVYRRKTNELINPEYRKDIIENFNTKKETKYKNINNLIETRDKYLKE